MFYKEQRCFTEARENGLLRPFQKHFMFKSDFWTMATHTMSDAIFFFKSEVHTKSLVQEYPTVKAWPDIILEQRKWSEKMTKVNTEVPGCLASMRTDCCSQRLPLTDASTFILPVKRTLWKGEHGDSVRLDGSSYPSGLSLQTINKPRHLMSQEGQFASLVPMQKDSFPEQRLRVGLLHAWGPGLIP